MLVNPFPVGKSQYIASRALAVTMNIPRNIDSIITGGYYAADGRGALLYERDAVSEGAGGFISNDGAKWRVVTDVPSFCSYGAYGDGTNVAATTAAIQDAIESGKPFIRIDAGANFLTEGNIINRTGTLRGIIAEEASRITLDAAAGRVALHIDDFNVNVYGLLDIRSNGLISDGFNTEGLKIGSATADGGGVAFIGVQNFYLRNFSGYGLRSHLGVAQNFGVGVCVLNKYGMSFEGEGGIPATTITVVQAYITNAERGLNCYQTQNFRGQFITEFCGTLDPAINGAIHLENVSAFDLLTNYCEANNRNFVWEDALVNMFDDLSTFPATDANDIGYAAAAFDIRGTTQINNYIIRAREIGPDNYSGYDLTVGDLVVPHAGGRTALSVANKFIPVVETTVVSGVATTVATVTGQAGDGAARKSYLYTVFVGRADLTTGVDTGIIQNGVLTSFSNTGGVAGAPPAWLSLVGNDLKVNIVQGTYGLDCGVTLIEITPGAGT